MHIVVDIINILLSKYIYFYAKICKNVASRSVKRNRQIIKHLLKQHEAQT